VKPARIAIALAGAGAFVLAGAGPAAASEESVGSCLVETIEELGGGEAVEGVVEAGHAEGAGEEAEEALVALEDEFEGCLEAPNPILPETNEIVWGGLSFAVLLFAMIRWGFPMVADTMRERSEKIQSDIDSAEADRADAARIKAEQEAALAETRAGTNQIIDEARQEAATVRADLIARAEADVAELRRQGEADVAAARQRALGDLQNEVNDIVVGAAERVVGQNLDHEAQRHLIDSYIDSVGRT
jgi:F-type H+-transporting ATPase subunit b